MAYLIIFKFFEILNKVKNLLVIAPLITGLSVFCYSGELPDTGQYGDYTATFGEDSDYNSPASSPSYTVVNSSVVLDNRTGLMWVKDGDSAGCNNGNSLTWEGALSFCEGLDFAGYDDWRLPNVRELESIVDAGESIPAINTTYFLNTNTQSSYYWSSTTLMAIATKAMFVVFNDGVVNFTEKSFAYSYFVRPVRGGP